MIWYDMIWYGMIWYDRIWYDMMWYDMIWCDVIWYDIIWYVCMHACVCVHACMHACLFVWMDEWMNGWMDGWMCGCVDVWMCLCVCVYIYTYIYITFYNYNGGYSIHQLITVGSPACSNWYEPYTFSHRSFVALALPPKAYMGLNWFSNIQAGVGSGPVPKWKQPVDLCNLRSPNMVRDPAIKVAVGNRSN